MEFIQTRILKTQRIRMQAILGYPPKMKVEKYVQTALEERLMKDEKKKN